MNKPRTYLDIDELNKLDDRLTNISTNYTDQAEDLTYRIGEFIRRKITVIPKADVFAKWILENRYIKDNHEITEEELYDCAKIYLAELEVRITKSTSTNTNPNWNSDSDQLITLYNGLLNHGFIGHANNLKDFLAIFDTSISNVAKIEWIKISTKNKLVNKKALYDLLYLLVKENLINEIKIEKVIDCFFILPNNRPFDFQPANKGGRDNPSEFMTELEAIVKSVKANS